VSTEIVLLIISLNGIATGSSTAIAPPTRRERSSRFDAGRRETATSATRKKGMT
jgi:hypothetical protein